MHSDVQRSGLTGDYKYRSDIRTRFLVDGQSRVLYEIYPGQSQIWSGDNSSAVRQHSRYDVGDKVAVYVDPGDTDRALIEPGIHFDCWAVLLAALVPFLLGLWLLAYSVLSTRRWSTQKSTPGSSL